MHRHLIIASTILAVSGCASIGDIAERNESPSQFYRLAGQETPVSISGSMERTYAGFDWVSGTEKYDRTVRIYIDQELAISGNLSPTYTGDLSSTWQGRPVSTSCSSEQVSPTWQNVRCIVFVENERTVTLTF